MSNQNDLPDNNVNLQANQSTDEAILTVRLLRDQPPSQKELLQDYLRGTPVRYLGKKA